MSRYLFVVPPLTGHVNPAVGIAGELRARGHEVALAAHVEVVGQLLPPDLPVIRLAGGFSEDVRERSASLRGPASLRFLWEDFLIPLGIAMLPQVDAAIDAFAPDVVVADQQAIGAAFAARRRGLPWATLATTSAEFDAPYAMMDGIGVWVADRLREFEVACGAPAGGGSGPGSGSGSAGDLRFSEHLTLVCSVRSLLRSGGSLTGPVYIGTATGWREPSAFPWDRLDPGRLHVGVSLGTVTRDAGARFLTAAVAALGMLADRVQGIVVAPDDVLLDVPDNVLVRPYVPQLDLLGHLSAMVSHAGNNTVCESLAQGVPLVVAPVRDDQPIIADQVVTAGAGVRVKFGRATPAVLRDAISRVLDDPSYTATAAALSKDFAAAGGVTAAADQLEDLARPTSQAHMENHLQ